MDAYGSPFSHLTLTLQIRIISLLSSCQILSCSCLDFTKRKPLPCKHLFLAERVFHDLWLSRFLRPSASADIIKDRTDDLNDGPNDNANDDTNDNIKNGNIHINNDAGIFEQNSFRDQLAVLNPQVCTQLEYEKARREEAHVALMWWPTAFSSSNKPTRTITLPPDVAHRILENDIKRFGDPLNMRLYIDGDQAEEKTDTAKARDDKRHKAPNRTEKSIDVLEERLGINLRVRKRHFMGVKAGLKSSF
ncbi:hypothetical protein EC957_007863 [Mortierella hygrophila]|uniref:SWIM-type domain-containing protein n=1 Tax=Mortierella hygrophila TaxID=979708 RepID=A0A9P6EXN0_9FUNG|nr:hypothetical protein EC957_007863 [Mortierella hygrophila]